MIDVIFSGSFPCRPFVFLLSFSIYIKGSAVMSSHGFLFSASPSAIMAFYVFFTCAWSSISWRWSNFSWSCCWRFISSWTMTPKLKKMGNPKRGRLFSKRHIISPKTHHNIPEDFSSLCSYSLSSRFSRSMLFGRCFFLRTFITPMPS